MYMSNDYRTIGKQLSRLYLILRITYIHIPITFSNLLNYDFTICSRDKQSQKKKNICQIHLLSSNENEMKTLLETTTTIPM